jgi:hypothetical protein
MPGNSHTRLFFSVPLFIAAAFLLFSAVTGFRFAPEQDHIWILIRPPGFGATVDYYVSGAVCLAVGLLVTFYKRER